MERTKFLATIVDCKGFLYSHTSHLHLTPLDGATTNDLFIFMNTQDGTIYCVWIHLFIPPYTLGERRKTTWSELELNSGPLASQATSVTTRPCLLRKGKIWVISVLYDLQDTTNGWGKSFFLLYSWYCPSEIQRFQKI